MNDINDSTIHENESVTPALMARVAQAIHAQGGWLAFDQLMQMALYEPGLGYYAHARRKIGRMPAQRSASGALPQNEGSDFVTAPEISRLFGKTLARQIDEALQHTGTDTVYEFGAGNGTLARDILSTLGTSIRRYCIVDVSGTLRARQAQTLAAFADRVQWLDALPDELHGVLIGNEVLDAMPVKLLSRTTDGWQERGVILAQDGHFQWVDRPSEHTPPLEIPGDHAYLTEIHPIAEAFVRTTSERLKHGAAIWIDYGFSEHEYYHPQRHMGTLMCHHQHQADDNPLLMLGEKDITSHVNFTGVAVAAQDMGLEVLGYTTQARFLINCGIEQDLSAADLAERIMASKLLYEHEMGELFKVIMLGTGPFWEPLGFKQGDRTHTL